MLSLPTTVVHGAILNPLIPTKYMVSSSLVTEEQLKRGVESLTRVLEKRYELEAPHDEMSDVDDSNLGFDFLPPVTSVRAIDQAKMEVNSFLRYYKKQAAMPKFKNTSAKNISMGVTPLLMPQ